MNLMKKIAAFLAVCVFFAAGWQLLRYISVDDTQSFTRLAAHEFYQQDEIDIAFVGASHVVYGISTDIADDMLGKNTFNLGSSSQHPDGSYTLIKEAISNYNVEHIYFDVSYAITVAFDMEEREGMTRTYIISDYMRMSLNKLSYLLNASSDEDYVNDFLLARRDYKNCFDRNYLMALLGTKGDGYYQNYGYVSTENADYRGKGSCVLKKVIEDGTFYTAYEEVGNDMISDEWYEYLDKIISCCREHNVELTLISVPISNYQLCYWGAETYDAYVRLVSEIAQEAGVDYYDFNLCREEYWEDTSAIYDDKDHLNEKGSERFTRLFCNMLTGEVAESDLFYASLDEKLDNMEPAVYGLVYQDEKDEMTEETLRRVVTVVANRDENYEYRIELTPIDAETQEEADTYLIQDFSHNKEFEVPLSEHGTCTLFYRNAAQPEQVTGLEITY